MIFKIERESDAHCAEYASLSPAMAAEGAHVVVIRRQVGTRGAGGSAERGPSLRHVSVVVGALILGFLLIAEVDSAWKVLHATSFLTARPASRAVLLYGLSVAAIVGWAYLAPARFRILAIAGPALALAGVLVATATLGGRAVSMIAAVLGLCSLWLVGRWTLRILGVPQLAEHAVVAGMAGLAPLCLLTLLLGRLSLFKWWDLGLLIVALGVIGAAQAGRTIISHRRALGRELLGKPLAAAAAGIILLTIAVAAVYTAAPEIQYDALYGKAYLPALWTHTGTIGPLTRHIQLNIGGWWQFVAGWGDLLGGFADGRYLQLIGLMIAPAAAWHWARRRNGLGPIFAVGLVLTPALFWQATTSDDDLLLGLAGFALALAVLETLGVEGGTPARSGGLVIGLMAGTGVSLKAHLIPLCVFLLIGWAVAGRTPGEVVRRLSWAVAGALIAAAPPLILRWIDTGNPLFPAYNNIFKSQYWLPVNEKLNFPFWASPGAFGPLSGLWKGIFQPSVMNEAAPPGSFAVPVLLVGCTLLGGWRAMRLRRGLLLVWGAILIAALAWWIEFRYLRYLLPTAFACGAFLLGVVHQRRVPRAAVNAAGVGLLIGAAASFAVIVAMFWNVPNQNVPINASIGRWSADSYLATAFPEREAILAFNRLSPPGSIFLTGSLSAYERDWLTGGRDLYVDWETSDLLRRYGQLPANADQSVRALSRMGIGWLVIADQDPSLPQIPFLWYVLKSRAQIRFAARGWDVFQIERRPTLGVVLSACDRVSGIPRCWARTPTGNGAASLTRTVRACPGQNLALSLDVRGTSNTTPVSLEFPGAGALDATQPGIFYPGRSTVYGTVPSGAKSAVIDITLPAGATVQSLVVTGQGVRCLG